ncbi:MAG: RNA polymerase factor sigma-54 [Candidatus Cryosericum sp.]
MPRSFKMRSSQKQRQQLTLRQKSYLATRGLVLEQPLSDFETLMDRFAADSIVAEKHTRVDASGEMWNGDLDSFADTTESTPAELIADELLDRSLIDDSQIECARFVASDLDERGFFTKQISRYAVSIGVPTVEVRRILSAIQTLEPAGLGARDTAHAYALQMLRVLPDLPVPACARFLRVRQRSVSPGVIRACLKKLGIECDSATFERILTALDPEPARRMTSGPTHIVVPDIIIEQDALTGALQCSIPGPAWRLAIDPMVVSSARKDPEAKKRVLTEITKVRWIDDAIAERTAILGKLGEALVTSLGPSFTNQSAPALRVPVEHLIQETGMSRTVMVRALRRKYVKTPRGTFRLRSLVMDRWQTAATPIKETVALLLQPGRGSKPMSDREIAELLASQGLHISRRTVAKYRLSLGIPARYFRDY